MLAVQLYFRQPSSCTRILKNGDVAFKVVIKDIIFYLQRNIDTVHHTIKDMISTLSLLLGALVSNAFLVSISI